MTGGKSKGFRTPDIKATTAGQEPTVLQKKIQDDERPSSAGEWLNPTNISMVPVNE